MFEIAAEPIFALCLIVAGAMLACLHLFISLKRECHSVGQMASVRARNLEAMIGEVDSRCAIADSKVAHLGRSLQTVEAQMTLRSSLPPPARSALQEKRTAVILMAQKGERPDAIAGAVGIPANEVDLLLKVHRAVSEVR